MAENYVLFTDSACDIHPDKLAEWNVKMLPLAFLFTDTNVEQKDHDEPITEFYKAMRAGRVAKTSCVNEEAFERRCHEMTQKLSNSPDGSSAAILHTLKAVSL